MLINVARRVPVLALLGIFLVTAGCKTTGEHVRWYSGPPQQPNKIALLKVQRGNIMLTVDKIDGQSLTKGEFVGNNTAEIELLPGEHDLELSYRDTNDYHSTTDKRLTFFAEPGQTYELHGAPLERSFGKLLMQSLFFQHWYWTAWIVDAKTQKVVAGMSRETPVRWYEK
jgi:hypothetical protein